MSVLGQSTIAVIALMILIIPAAKVSEH